MKLDERGVVEFNVEALVRLGVLVLVGGQEFPVRIEKDTAGRGKADTFEVYEQKDGKTVIARREEDKNGDGVIDVTSIYEDGKLKRREVTDPDLVPL